MQIGILDAIGHTPMISLRNIPRLTNCRILFKYERSNPGGSIKDRSALHIITEAEKRGLVKPGATIIESSSGNFGISLAMISAAKGYHAIILVDPKVTDENLALLKSFGAEVIVVSEQDESGSYHKTRIRLANKLAREIPNSFRPDQCFNLLNGDAHYRTTARQIVSDCGGRITALVAAVSTGGQLGGISRYMKNHLPHVKIVGVDAVGSAIFGGQSHGYCTPGVGLSWTPNNLNMDLVDCAYKVTDEGAFVTARAVARHEGILIGPSGGACTLAALALGEQLRPKDQVVCVISDGGERYVHTLFNEQWLNDKHISLNTELETVRQLMLELRPWSTEVANCANYKPEYEDILSIPETTRRINQEITN